MENTNYLVHSCEHYRQQLAFEVGDAATVLGWQYAACAFPDVYVASACLQKALRRADYGSAHAAAEMLRVQDNARLWRRLVVCAFEDFGLSDFGVAARVTAAAASRNFRLVQGEERVLHYLIDLLIGTAKDRRLDDLYALAARVLADPGYLQIVSHGAAGAVIAPLVHAAARLMGLCERPVPNRSFRSLSSSACEHALEAMGRRGLIDGGLFELCLKGTQVSKCLLPVFLPLALEATERAGGRGNPAKQILSDAPDLSGVPAYAFDGFTRVGRAHLNVLAREAQPLKELLAGFAAKDRPDICHHMLFFAEGGRCNNLLDDGLAQALTRNAVLCGTRQPNEVAAQAAIALMGDLLPQLHALRAKARALSPDQETLR